MNKTSGKLQACFGGLLWVLPIVIYKSSPHVLASSVTQISASHPSDGDTVAVRTAFATGQPRCYPVILLVPWLETRVLLSFLDSKICFFPAHFVALKHYFLRIICPSTIPTPFFLLYTTVHRLLCCAVFRVILSNVSKSSTTSHDIRGHGVEPPLPPALHTLSPSLLYSRILPCGGTESSMRCQMLNYVLFCFVLKNKLCLLSLWKTEILQAKIKTPGFLCDHRKPQPTIHPRQWVHFSGPFFLSPLKLRARWLNRVQSSRNLKIQHCSAAPSFTQQEHEWKPCLLIGFSEVCRLLNSKTWKMFIVILPLNNLNKLHLAGEDR